MSDESFETRYLVSVMKQEVLKMELTNESAIQKKLRNKMSEDIAAMIERKVRNNANKKNSD